MRWSIATLLGGALCSALAATAVAQGIPHAELKIDDTFILGTRANVDQEEIETARYAAAHASRKDVRLFAQSLLRGHVNAQNAASRLASQMNTRMQIAADTSAAISQRQRDTDAELRHLSGAKFDRAFLTAIRDEHAAEIDKVNSWYANVATSDSVKAYLHDIMPTLVKHQQGAERLLAATNRTVAVH
jgi:putative membrane protein